MRILLVALVLLCAGSALAQTDGAPVDTSQSFGDYDVYFNVFPASMLSEQVAADYQIVRGKDLSVVNVTVRKRQPGGGDREQIALVKGIYSDLIQNKDLVFREISEAGAVYYIAQLRHDDHALLRFDIKVQPDPNAAAFAVSFTRTLYIDP
jgi:hypothetical protein